MTKLTEVEARQLSVLLACETLGSLDPASPTVIAEAESQYPAILTYTREYVQSTFPVAANIVWGG